MRAWTYLAEHDVRFFEGFLARDAALLHTSDGQLETALTLFGTLDRGVRALGCGGAAGHHVGQPAGAVRAARPSRGGPHPPRRDG